MVDQQIISADPFVFRNYEETGSYYICRLYEKNGASK